MLQYIIVLHWNDPTVCVVVVDDDDYDDNDNDNADIASALTYPVGIGTSWTEPRLPIQA